MPPPFSTSQTALLPQRVTLSPFGKGHPFAFDKPFIDELGQFTNRITPYLCDTIITLQRELDGFPPVWALDFDILHAYLFPSLQLVDAGAPRSLAAFVIDNSPIPFVLPPGTVAELVRFANRNFPEIRQVYSTLRNKPPRNLSRLEQRQILDLYRRLSRSDEKAELAPDPGEDKIIEFMARELSLVIRGFERLNTLLLSQKLHSIDKFFPGWQQLYNSNQVSNFVARIAAHSDGRRKTNERNYEDARNITTVLAIEKARRRQKPRYRSEGDQPTMHSLQLLTNTKAILKLHLQEDLPEDNVKVSPGIMRERTYKHADIFCNLESAAVYCSFRAAYGSTQDTLTQIRLQHSDLAKLEAAVYDVNLFFDNYKQESDIKSSEAVIEEVFSDNFAKWYYVLRQALSGAAIEARSLQQLKWRPHDFDIESAGRLTDTHLYADHAFSKLKLRESPFQRSIDVILDAFSIQQSNRQYGTILPVRRLLLECPLLNETILHIDTWKTVDCISAQWVTRLTIEDAIQSLNSVISHLEEISGEILADYEIAPGSYGQALSPGVSSNAITVHSKQCLRLPTDKPLSLISVLDVGSASLQHSLLLPSTLTLATELGDLIVPIASSFYLQPKNIVVNFRDAKALSTLVNPMLQLSHAWSWCQPLIAYLQSLIETSVNERDNNAIQ